MRELRPALEALIATGLYGMHTTHDIRLTDGTQIFLSSGEIFIDSVDKSQQYQAVLEEIQSLLMSLDVEADMQQFNITNVDMVIGRVLTGSIRQLDGARTIIGAIFIDTTKPFLSANFFWDARMPCEISSGEVSDDNVDFTATSDVDAITVSGRLIVEEFPWREPINVVPAFDPNDFNPPGRDPDDPGGFRGGRGRYGDMDFPQMMVGL